MHLLFVVACICLLCMVPRAAACVGFEACRKEAQAIEMVRAFGMKVRFHIGSVPHCFHTGAGLLTCFVFTRVSEPWQCLQSSIFTFFTHLLQVVRQYARVNKLTFEETSETLHSCAFRSFSTQAGGLELFRLCFLGRLGLVIRSSHRLIQELFGHLDADGDGAIDEEE